MSGTPTQTRAKGKPFHFAESRKESHCKTRLELATPALTSNAASLSFWGKVVLYQLSYFRICFTNSAHFWLRSLRESKLSHSRGEIPRSIYKQKKDSYSCPQERNSCTNESKGKTFSLCREQKGVALQNEARTRDPSIDKQCCILIFLGQGCALPTELFPHLFHKFSPFLAALIA